MIFVQLVQPNRSRCNQGKLRRVVSGCAAGNQLGQHKGAIDSAFWGPVFRDLAQHLRASIHVIGTASLGRRAKRLRALLNSAGGVAGILVQVLTNAAESSSSDTR
jgi:hypothetical protein